MKNLLCIVLICIAIFTLVGCGAEKPAVIVNVENDSNLSGQIFGETTMIEIGNGLWYDSTTRIVYWWNGIIEHYHTDTVPSPYYAPNGLPYLYNPKTNTLEEIER